MQNVNEEIFADVRAVDEFNRRNGTRYTYGQYKLMVYLDLLNKKKSLHRKSGPTSERLGRQSRKIIVKRKAVNKK